MILLALVVVLFGAGCAQNNISLESIQTSASESTSSAPNLVRPSDANTELWIVQEVSADQITYVPIEWFTGDQALTEARKDGCEDGCAPNGFYWRYQGGDKMSKMWLLGDTSSIRVKLICNRGDCYPDNPSVDGFKSLSYTSYLSADSHCRTTPTDCAYYAIGTGMDFFQVTFSDDDIIMQLSEWYVP